ncbi:hypothetical protein CHISP_3146 [Chitinispirillum alkaliphilum]|nr:hypothetical protein CHISP_3146 [Chitinispirillum alkaliphilum]
MIARLIIIITVLWAHSWAESVSFVALMPSSENFKLALRGIEDELMGEYEIEVIDVDKVSPEEAFDLASKYDPSALILMDAKAVRFAEHFQNENEKFVQMPKFVLMTLQVEKTAKNLENTVGIRFEVPGYTTFTNFRIISERDFSKVGVFYRKDFQEDIMESQRLLAREEIEIISYCLDCDNSGSELSERDALRGLNAGWRQMRRDGVEVLWMLADNAILNAATLRDFWIRTIASRRIPVVVPLERFVETSANLGVFVTQPDYLHMGSQLAGQIFQFFEDGEELENIGFEPLISITSVLNANRANRIRWGLDSERLGRVDRILE